MKIAVVGGGPAGVSCASFLKRYGANVIIYEKRVIGGLIENAWCVENFPLVEPSSGVVLANRLRKIVKENNIQVVFDEILSVNGNTLLGRHGSYNTDVIVLATGTAPKRIIEFEVNDRVVYEYRDLPSDVKSLAIYGGGDVAFDSAIQAKLRGINVKIFIRGNSIRAVPKLVEKASELKIEIGLNSQIKSVKDVKCGVEITTSVGEFYFDALLVAVGREVNLPEVRNASNVYIIGDAAHVEFRQASIAVGDGIRCAMDIIMKNQKK